MFLRMTRIPAESPTMQSMSAAEVIALLKLKPHPEGGHFRETFRDSQSDANGRSLSTAIYYLLGVGEVSEWHRVDATEAWFWHGGAPMVLTLSANGHDAEAHHLGPELKASQRPQLIVPTNWWQTATSLGAWSLVSCTVAPGFEFSAFEMAPKGWRPTPRPSWGVTA